VRLDAWTDGLPPGIARASDGAIAIGGVVAPLLAERYGTPLLVVDTDVLDANVARIALAADAVGAEVAYAGKALLFVELARRLKASPFLLDVCSMGELLTAERAGFPASRLVFHGCGKTDAELDAAASGRVGRVVVDGFEELSRLASRTAQRPPIDVMLRINSGVSADTHAHVRTGGENSKFGFSLAAADAAVEAAGNAAGLRLVGIHTHIGSQIFDVGALLDGLDAALDVFAQARKRGAPASTVVVGGGFGVGSRPSDVDLEVETSLATLAEALLRGSAARGMPPPRLGIEPGRAIVANAGTSLYRVLAVKRHGSRRFAIVDGGIADNPRPALYGAYHHPLAASRSSQAGSEDTSVCGRSCESDELVVAPLLTDLRAGDLIALCGAGGYTFSMASNYNRFPRPAVAFAGAGKHRLVVRRERDADLLANDVGDDA